MTRWQLENTATGEWCMFAEDDLLDQFTRNELSFDATSRIARPTWQCHAPNSTGAFPSIRRTGRVAQDRVQYLKEIDRRQPIAITSKTMEPLIRSVSERINDTKPPGWRTLSRDYRKWLAAGRDIRAIMLRHSDRGSWGPRLLPEVKTVTDQVIEELYMTAERKRVPKCIWKSFAGSTKRTSSGRKCATSDSKPKDDLSRDRAPIAV